MEKLRKHTFKASKVPTKEAKADTKVKKGAKKELPVVLAKQDSSTDEEETSGIEHEHSRNQSLTVRVEADSHTILTSKSFQNRIKIVVRIVVESSILTVAIE